MMAVIVFFMMVRWSWPRFRFDQLMALAWKVMLPLGLVNLVAVAVVSRVRRELKRLPSLASGQSAGVMAVLLVAGRRRWLAGPAARRQPSAPKRKRVRRRANECASESNEP